MVECNRFSIDLRVFYVLIVYSKFSDDIFIFKHTHNLTYAFLTKGKENNSNFQHFYSLKGVDPQAPKFQMLISGSILTFSLKYTY